MMKLTKKLAITGMVLASTLLLGACKGQDKKTDAANDKKEISVGVLQVVSHPSLDSAYKGFKEALKEAGYEDGKNLKITFQNAQNSQDNLKSMSEKLVKDKPDLLLAIGTPSAQSLLNETQEIPITVTAVTDLPAAKLVKSNEKPGGNVTGTSDMVPIDKQIKLLHSLMPEGKKVGLIYNAGEANSKLQADIAEKAVKAEGLELKTVTINSTNDVQQALASLGKSVDGIYVPTDNTMASSAALIEETSKSAKIPVVTGWAEGQTGSVATVGINYEELGKQTGEMAVKILKGESKPKDMAVETLKNLKLYVNKDLAKVLGIDPDTIKEP